MEILMLLGTYFWLCINFFYRCPICSTASLTSAELMETQEGYLSFPTVWSKNCIFTFQNIYKSSVKIVSEGLLWMLQQTNTHDLGDILHLWESHANLMKLLRCSGTVWDTCLNQAVVDCLMIIANWPLNLNGTFPKSDLNHCYFTAPIFL